MKRKFMLQLSAVAFAVLAMVVLVACSSGVDTGFKNQTSLAKAYVKMDLQEALSLDDYGEGATVDESLRFAHNADQVNSGLGKLMLESLKLEIKEKKAVHKKMMDGSWVESYKEDGSVDKRLKDNETGWKAYKDGYNDAKAAFKSLSFIKVEKNVEMTKTATNGGNGRATAAEVWTVEYKYNDYSAGVKGTENTQTENVRMIKVGGKWYLTSYNPFS